MAVGQEVGTSDRSAPQATTGIDPQETFEPSGFQQPGRVMFPGAVLI